MNRRMPGPKDFSGFAEAMRILEQRQARERDAPLPPWLKEACEEIDAAFFSGDCFDATVDLEDTEAGLTDLTPEAQKALTAMEHYLGRWNRRVAEIRELYKVKE